MDDVERGSSGWGRFPGISSGACADWVNVLGREVGCLPTGRGREALNWSEVGTGDVEVGRI